MAAMKFLYFSCILFVYASAAHSSIQDGYAKLRDAAAKHSLETKRARNSYEAAQLETKITSKANLPRVSALSTWSIQKPPRTGDGRDLTYGGRVTYDVLDFGKSGSAARISKLEEDISSFELDVTKENLQWQVAQSYIDAIGAAMALKITNENHNIAGEKLKNIESGYKQGLRPELDVVAANGDVAAADLALEKATTNLHLAKSRLNSLIGSSDVVDSAMQSIDDDFSKLKNWKQKSTSLKNEKGHFLTDSILEKEQEKVAQERKRIQASLLPTISAAGVAEKSQLQEDKRWQVSAQLQMTWDLPWHGQFRDQYSQNSINTEVLSDALAIDQRDRLLEEKLAQQDLDSLGKQEAIATRALGFRSEQFTLLQRRYNQGKSTVLELNNASVELNQAKLELLRTYLATADALVRLGKARGVSDPKFLFEI
jgi:outer membrane protein